MRRSRAQATASSKGTLKSPPGTRGGSSLEAGCFAAADEWAGLPAIRLNTQEIMVENLVIYTGRGYLETHRVIEHGLPRIYMEKRF